ncbi:uncharacterized protein LOC9638922 isoform X2 [Selaginella moellendorffii]|uniref:uncharacterized protein LOC9638922 isoform X2 n=1 Tax=Selaginella moellendorffii TaxID=88036 RepID=UPI000D1C8B9B|nr:uncharacterized protein LOC9638922 isoform X2 [Selaginella moellendorffii]|eukprot:XP_024518237.1 uncharacterized protein LOC9638922 isoform X2 [Selaginella moellendorffii]
MYVLQRRGSGRDTLSYGMADKDTHPHHYPSSSSPPPPPPPPPPHSLPSSSGAAPCSSSATAAAASQRHQRLLQGTNLKQQQHSAADLRRNPGVKHGVANHKPGGVNLRQTQQVLVNHRQDLARPEHNLAKKPAAGQVLARHEHNLAKQPAAGQNLPRHEHNLARQPAAGQNIANHKHGAGNHHGKLPKKPSSSIQQPIEAKKVPAPVSSTKPVTKPRSSRDDEASALSPKKKQLKLILKLRKPQQDGPELPPPPQGVRSKAPASNGVASTGLGSGSSGLSSPSGVTRSRHPEARSNGTAAAATAAGGSVEHRQRTPAAVTTTTTTTSASASESMEDEGLQQHSSRKRKFRDAPEGTGEEEKVAASTADAEDGSKRRMKEKDVRFVPTPTSGLLENGSPPHRVLEELLERFQKKDTYGVFAEPVDPEEIPDYLDIIKEPMDFSTIKKKLSKGAYGSIELFERDVNLICSNAMKYNAPRTIYYKQAKAIKDIARKAFDVLKGRLNGQRKGPGKQSKLKRCTTRRFSEQQGSDVTPGAGLADGKKASTIDRVADLSHKSNSPFQSSANDFEFPEGSLSKAASLKDGRRLLTVDENRRHTYRPPEPFEDAVVAQIVPSGVQYGGSYAQSLALFGANFKRPAWDFVARKIRKVLAPNVPFGPGWVGEHEKSSRPDCIRTEPAAQQILPRDEAKDSSQQPPAIEVPSSTATTSAGAPAAPVQLPFRPTVSKVFDVQQQHQHQHQHQQHHHQHRNGVQNYRNVEAVAQQQQQQQQPQQQQQQQIKKPPARFPPPLQRDHPGGSAAAENQAEASRYPAPAPPKFGPNGSVGFSGMDASRGAWSLQKALGVQESGARDKSSSSGGGLPRVFGQEHANPGRSNAEPAAAASVPSTMAFHGLSAYGNSSGNATSAGGPLFGMPGLGGQGMMAKQSATATPPQQPQPQQHHHQQQQLRPDMNASSADFFRQQSHDFHLKEQQQQQQQMGVYNAISQSLLQPWKSHRFQPQQQQQLHHLHQQQQQQQHHQQQHQHHHNQLQLRPLPPDLNVRLQSPKSPQHQAQSQLLLNLQQQQQQHQHQQQQQQQQHQQPDLALQL